jgi:hypothetical protein
VSDPINRAFGYVDLTIKNDVQGELALSDPEMKTLAHIAANGGEINWSWNDSSTKRATYDMVVGLINKELVIDREYTTPQTLLQASRVVRTTLRLTDKGRNVVDKHEQRKIVASETKTIQVT